jgi:hypothetical protein
MIYFCASNIAGWIRQGADRWAHIRQLADTGSSKKGRKKEVLSKKYIAGWSSW